MLFIRMFFVILVQLYTVPIVLRNLGISDYGLYNVVGGVVTMFSFLSGSLISGTQRYIAYALGKKDDVLLRETFRTIHTIFIIFSVVLFVVVEGVGLWLLHYKMNVPEGRMFAADCVFQFSIFSFVTNVLNIPYNSAIVAHERIGLYAYVSIFECVVKLAIAISLTYVVFDKLIFYAAGIFILMFIQRLFYRVYCYRQFEECRDVRISWNSEIGKGLLGYSGWNLMGTLSKMGRNQGLNVLMNMFYGTLLNAAHGIAMHINGVITKFISNLYMATRPPIIKLYARGDIEGMWNLVFRSAKLAFFLLTFLCVPVLVEVENILDLWLGEYPDYTVDMVIVLVSIVIVETLVNQLVSALQAANKVKKCQRNGALIILMCLPVSYVLLKFFQAPPLAPYYVSLTLSVIEMSYIVYLTHKEIQLDAKAFLKKVIAKDVFVFVVTLLLVYLIAVQQPQIPLRIVITVIASTAIASGLIWSVGLDKKEKEFVVRRVKKIIHKK